LAPPTVRQSVPNRFLRTEFVMHITVYPLGAFAGLLLARHRRLQSAQQLDRRRRQRLQRGPDQRDEPGCRGGSPDGRGVRPERKNRVGRPAALPGPHLAGGVQGMTAARSRPGRTIHITRGNQLMNIVGKTSLALFCAAFLAACGGGLDGTYASSNGAMSVKFASGKAYVESFGGTAQVDYQVDGDQVILKSPNGNMVLTRNHDGSLGGSPFGDLKKEGS
jgi:hypothetical protein